VKVEYEVGELSWGVLSQSRLLSDGITQAGAN
jgi:hypothetical protein